MPAQRNRPSDWSSVAGHWIRQILIHWAIRTVLHLQGTRWLEWRRPIWFCSPSLVQLSDNRVRDSDFPVCDSDKPHVSCPWHSRFSAQKTHRNCPRVSSESLKKPQRTLRSSISDLKCCGPENNDVLAEYAFAVVRLREEANYESLTLRHDPPCRLCDTGSDFLLRDILFNWGSVLHGAYRGGRVLRRVPCFHADDDNDQSRLKRKHSLLSRRKPFSALATDHSICASQPPLSAYRPLPIRTSTNFSGRP